MPERAGKTPGDRPLDAVPAPAWNLDALDAHLGPDAVDVMIRLWGGRRVRIPPGGVRERYARHRRIRTRLDAGETYAAAAAAEGLSLRQALRAASRL